MYLYDQTCFNPLMYIHILIHNYTDDTCVHGNAMDGNSSKILRCIDYQFNYGIMGWAMI